MRADCGIARCMCWCLMRAARFFSRNVPCSRDTAKGKWDSSSSGHLDTGEDYDTCAVREVREEIGLNIQAGTATGASQPLQRLFKIDARKETVGNFAGFIAAKAKGRSCCIPRKSKRAHGSCRTR